MFELCGKSVCKELMDVKGEFYRGERIYQVLHNTRSYHILQKTDCYYFKEFIRKVVNALALIQMAGIVHCDLKPENILVKLNQ